MKKTTLTRLVESSNKETCSPEKDMWMWISDETLVSITPPDGTSADDWEILPYNGLVPYPHNETHGPLHFFVLLQSQMLLSLLYENTCMTMPESITHTTKALVILGSLQDFPETTIKVRHLYPYPPKEHGTTAFVLGKEQYRYYIKDLSPDAQDRQKKISQLIETLQSLPQEETFNVFVDSPEELRTMVQRLAEDYYQHHQSQTPRKRAIPHTPNLFEHGSSNTSSCLPIQAVIAGIQDARSVAVQWQKPEGHAPFFRYEKPKGTAIVEYKTGEKTEVFDDKTTASLWRQVKNFSDDDADVVLALFAQLIRPSGNDGTTWFLAAQFLDYRGIQPIMKSDVPGGKKRRAGHRQEDIKAVGDSIGRIENIWITLHQWIDETASGKKKRKRTEFTHKGRLLMVEEAYTQRELPEGDTESDPGIEIGWRIRPGSWLRTFLESPNRQVANLCQKSLQYDPYREQWEKRLSRYFMFHGHINTHGGGGTFNREIGKMLQEVSLEADQRKPQRTRDRFEKAMNTLVGDKIIQEWCYEADVSLPTKGWLPTWLEQKITIHIAPTRDIIKR